MCTLSSDLPNVRQDVRIADQIDRPLMKDEEVSAQALLKQFPKRPSVVQPPLAEPSQIKHKTTCCKTILKDIKSEEYLPLWVGLIWYSAVLGYTFWGLESVPTFYPWTNNLGKTFSMFNFTGLILIIGGVMVSLSLVHQVTGKPYGTSQYLLLQGIVFCCSIIGSNVTLRSAGLGTSIWCIFAGIFLRVLLRRKANWLKSKTYDLEFFIKISIVLLAVNFRGLGVVGGKALMVSWVETLLILPLIFSIGMFVLKMNKQQALVTAAGVSICGSSAAMTVGDCVKVQKEALTSLIAVMSILTIPCIPTLPLLDVESTIMGAWIGGSIDSTGAVMASASLKSEETADMAIIVKMLQNILIGFIALAINFAWNKTCSMMILWTKFPKFVLGFILVAIVTSFMPSSIVHHITTNSFTISEWFASISFVIIGFDIDLFTVWSRAKKFKLIILLYIIGQLIDLGTTFGMAYLFFGIVK